MNEKKKVRAILIVIILIVTVAAIYFTFFYSKKCEDMACFNSALSKCRRVKFLNDAEDAAWLYKIKGKRGEECKVQVELLKLKEGSTDLLILEGKNMECFLPFSSVVSPQENLARCKGELSSVVSPQENLARCKGELKEGMQEIIIKRLHNYIIDNLGEISEELEKAV